MPSLFLLLLTGALNADEIMVAEFRALPQEKSNWCWAASIQSVFLTKGVEITQSAIVAAAYGTPVNKTAPAFEGTLGILNGLVVSADGSRWAVRASSENAFPDPNWLYYELLSNKPVMIWYANGTANHSIVITGGEYSIFGGIYWYRIYAYDPWLNQNIIIDAADIPRYVYGSFEIQLDRLSEDE